MQNNIDVGTSGFAITPSDAARYPVARAIRVGGAGNLFVIAPNGVVVPFPNAQAGEWIFMASVGVMATNTTATSLTAIQ